MAPQSIAQPRGQAVVTSRDDDLADCCASTRGAEIAAGLTPAHMSGMVWDLRGALLKKEERESARRMEFAFRLRARTWRLIAEALDDDAEGAARLTAKHDDQGLLALLAQRHPDRASDLATLHRDCEAVARRQLIAERGDPSPYRLL